MDLIHSLDGIVWEADAQTLQYTFVSSQAERLLGYPCEQWLREPDFWFAHTHPDDRAAAVAACMESIERRAARAFEYRMIALDGREVWVRDTVTVHQQEGLPTQLRGVMIEITSSRAQAHALSRLSQLYTALTHINEAVVAVKTRAALFEKICEALVEFGKLKMAWIGWNDPIDSTIGVECQYGDTDGYLHNVTVRSDDAPGGHGPFGLAMRSGEPNVINDFLQAAREWPCLAAAKRSDFRAVGAFPIRAGGQVCGALVGYASEVDFFGSRETELLVKAASHISFTLDHFEGEMRRQAAEAAVRHSESRFRQMFEDTADAQMLLDLATHRLSDCNQAAVDMLHCSGKEEILSLHPAALSPSHQPDGRTSTSKAEEMISIAIRNGSHRFEWVHCSAHREDFLTEVLLTPIVVGEQRLIIATLRDITERRRDELRQAALHQISEAAQSTATLPELFPRIHHIIGELLPAKNFFVALYDAVKDELTFPYFVDEFDHAPGSIKLNGGTLSGEVIRTGETLLLTPEDQQMRIEQGKVVVGSESVDWLGVPLKSRTHTIGVLVVQSYSGDVRYTEKDKALLEFVSGQVAVAIERKQAEEALRMSETRSRLILEQNQAGVFRTQLDGRLLECNEAFARLLGYDSKREIMGVNASSFYFEHTEREAFLALLHANGGVTNIVTRLRRKDGREVWGMETVALIRDAEDRPGVIQGTVTDFTDRKRADEALRLSESRLEEAQRLAHLGSWNWDHLTQTLSWSDELCRIFGVDLDAHVPSFKDFLSRVHDDDRAAIEALIAQALADQKPFSHEFRIVRLDGEMRTIFDQGEVLVDASGQLSGLGGACLDVTARKMQELLEQDRSLILEQVAQNKPLPEILSHIAMMLEAQVPKTYCSVVLLKDGRLHTAAAPHLPVSYTNALEGLHIGPAVGSCGTACYTGETVITEDIASDSRWDDYRELALRHGLRACWSVPIPSNEGGVLGSFAIYREYPSAPGARDLDFMGMASRLAAVAIEHRLLTDQLEHQAQHDALTGLPNRLLFRDRLSQALAHAERKQQQVAVLYMDLDRFKNINDTLGHSSGDTLLRYAASRLNDCIRSSDTLARLGGDEFVVVVTELSDPQDAMRVATELLEALRIPFSIDGHELFISVSLGISVYPHDGLDGETLMANADAAMYRAKDKGRDNFQWFAPEMNALARDRMDLESQLRHALRLDQLSLHYQPQCAADGQIQGFEALMRWQHPTLGMVSPARFIPLAEDSGLIVPMGEWALREACTQLMKWHEAGHRHLRVAVNVSAVQFKRTDWVDTVQRALRDSGLPPHALELEITESLLLQSVTETSANLVELRALGVSIAIDDFGTGYSSLSYLHKLPVTTLKIDQSFVHEIGLKSIPGQEDAPIIRTIIVLARNFGMSVVAEGVETEAQRVLLIRLGCESLQGYLLHRPLTIEQVDTLLQLNTKQLPDSVHS